MLENTFESGQLLRGPDVLMTTRIVIYVMENVEIYQ